VIFRVTRFVFTYLPVSNKYFLYWFLAFDYRKLGLSKIRVSPNHHKKRLAVESRNHRADDSHMFVIKLPPNPYYYAQHNKNAIDDSQKKVRFYRKIL
jgi:Domain of unknown function (DUF4786)